MKRKLTQSHFSSVIVPSFLRFLFLSFCGVTLAAINLRPTAAATLDLPKEARVVLLGNGLGSRMLHYGHFETEMHRRYPNHHLVIRNICDEGDTPAFRPHAGRANP
jgi:hypothetical protein